MSGATTARSNSIRMTTTVGLPNLAQQLPAGHGRQHDVKDHQIRGAGAPSMRIGVAAVLTRIPCFCKASLAKRQQPLVVINNDDAVPLGVLDGPTAHRAAFDAAGGRGGPPRLHPRDQSDRGRPFPAGQTHEGSERDVRSTGKPWTILRNSLSTDLRVQIAAEYLRDSRWTTTSATVHTPS